MQLAFVHPPASLSPFVEHLWYVDAAAHEHSPKGDKVLPSGTTNLMFNLSGHPHRDIDPRDPARWATLKDAWISGARNTYICIAPTVCTRVIGVRFKPGGLAPFFGRPVQEINHLTVDLHSIWGRQIERVHEQLFAAKNLAGQFRTLVRWLTSLSIGPPAVEPRVARALSLLQQSGGNFQVRHLADEIGLSQRQLARLFAQHVGLRPKEIGRVVRFQKLIHGLRGCRQVQDWPAVALAHGYYDQAHLIGELKTFTGLSPTDYLARRGDRLEFLPAE